VWSEYYCYSEMLTKMTAELHQTTKIAVQKLKEDAASIKGNPFKDWVLASAS